MRVIRFLLFPFSIIYNIITGVRNFLFDVGMLKSTSFSIPVIAVGNLNVGGTGKTPQIEYLIRLLKDTQAIAVLSRGYKRKTKGFLKVNENHRADDVGDEPLQFFKKFKNISVAVDTDRTNGIEQLLKSENPPEIVLLDDAFQHRKVKAGFYILLTKYHDLYSDDFLLPTGNLRESRKGAKRADMIVVTKCPNDLSKDKQEELTNKLKLNSNQQVFFSAIIYDEVLKGGGLITIDELIEKEVVLITGIANPNPLLAYLKSKNIRFKHLKYPDHHSFSKEDITGIKKAFNAISSVEKLIITTEKDYVRLQNNLANICYVEIKNIILDNKESFDAEIQSFVRR